MAAELCRIEWGLGTGPLSNVVGLLESKGVAVCRYEFAEEQIEAFSFWNGPRPFIFLSSDKNSAARARFDAAHELGHLILHRWIGSEEIEDPKVLKEVEREANRFVAVGIVGVITAYVGEGICQYGDPQTRRKSDPGPPSARRRAAAPLYGNRQDAIWRR